MLKKTILWAVLIIFLMFSSLALKMGNAEDVIKKKEIVKNVKVMTLEKEVYYKNATYIGVVQPSIIQKYSHKYGGTIKSIEVSEGEKISEDDVMIAFDEVDAQFSLEVSKNNCQITKANYEKALKGAKDKELDILVDKLNLANESYDLAYKSNRDVGELYKVGAISKLEYDKSALNLESKKTIVNEVKSRIGIMKDGATWEELIVLESLYNQAMVDYTSKSNIVDQCELKAKKKGYVMSLLCEEDENTGPGIPLIVVGSDANKIVIGVTQREIDKMTIGKACKIEIDKNLYNGEVALVNRSPDTDTMTYAVEIKIDKTSDDIYPGILGRVSIPIENQYGISIPIGAMLSDGEDYVYVMQDHRAKRMNVEIIDINEDRVIVKGPSEDQQLITEGMKGLKNGYKVTNIDTVEL